MKIIKESIRFIYFFIIMIILMFFSIFGLSHIGFLYLFNKGKIRRGDGKTPLMPKWFESIMNFLLYPLDNNKHDMGINDFSSHIDDFDGRFDKLIKRKFNKKKSKT